MDKQECLHLFYRIITMVRRRVNFVAMRPWEKFSRIERIPPCYHVYVPAVNEAGLAVDLGTGQDANFSQAILARFGIPCAGFDPTRRYHPYLEKLRVRTEGKFRFFPYAVTGKTGTAIFHEVQNRESGSLSLNHTNVRDYSSSAYEVRTVGLKDIFNLVEKDLIDIMKVDIEGEEYDFFKNAEPGLLPKVSQFLVEFHHHCIEDRTQAHNEEVIKLLVEHGFSFYTIDYINYIFYQRNFRKNRNIKTRKITI